MLTAHRHATTPERHVLEPGDKKTNMTTNNCRKMVVGGKGTWLIGNRRYSENVPMIVDVF